MQDALNAAQRGVAESTAEQRAVGQLVQELFGVALGSTQQVLKLMNIMWSLIAEQAAPSEMT